jgi:hypothetical protein
LLTLTWKPAVVRTWVAVCCESPTTGGTETAPPDTVMVMVAPGAAVPPLGFWLITWPAGEDEVASVLVSTLKPLDCRVAAA